MSSSDITILEYLKGVTSYDVSDTAFATISVKRNFELTTTISELRALPDNEGERIIDLATADLYMWCASTPSSKNDTEDSDGGWKHKEGGWQTSAYDKRQLRAMAQELYDKWGENTTKVSTVRLINL